MITHYKDHLIYLVLITFALYVGMAFSEVPVYVLKSGSYLFITPLIIFFINACFIYNLSFKVNSDKKRALLLSVLYLLAPTHLDSFLFPFQWQMLLSETFFLMSFFYYEKNEKLSLGSLLLAVCLNTKLIFFTTIFLLLKPKSRQAMVILSLVFVSVLLFTAISFYQSNYSAIENIKTFIYQLIALFVPLRINSFNTSIILSDFPAIASIVIYSFLLILSFGVLVFSKTKLTKVISLLWITASFGAFLPEKYILGTGGHSFYFLPTTYFLCTIVFLFLINSYLDAVKNKILMKGMLTILVLFWGIALFSWQRSSMNIVNMWKEEIAFLPESFNHEEEIKLTYAKILMKHELYDEAHELIQSNKSKFPNGDWYQMLLTIYSEKRDEAGINRVYEELIKSKIRIEMPEEN